MIQKTMKLLYSVLAIFALVGIITLSVIKMLNLIGGFLLGIVIVGIIIFMVFSRIKAIQENDGVDSQKMQLLTGTMAKLLVILLGVILCKLLPGTFSMLGYVIGLAVYFFVFAILAITEFIKTKNHGVNNSDSE